MALEIYHLESISKSTCSKQIHDTYFLITKSSFSSRVTHLYKQHYQQPNGISYKFRSNFQYLINFPLIILPHALWIKPPNSPSIYPICFISSATNTNLVLPSLCIFTFATFIQFKAVKPEYFQRFILNIDLISSTLALKFLAFLLSFT